ncbi:WD40 repeat domain-containing serine/threonine protein kinase [Nocardiopsis sp. NPDC058631]|uniref:WD40 repeat domain-containing serine/threonine protein kinase n=1 Tax=Nocardiopsis sp. NPDC058631 TaxID=3346566 RepID=UPI0036689C51
MRPLNPDEPTRLGEFRIIAHLGSGGMGRVYLGADHQGCPAAVTVVRAAYAVDLDFRARFAREAALAPRIRNRFTPPHLGHDLSAPVPWTATAYVPGPTLRTLVRRAGPFPPTAVTTLARGLAEALAAVHSAGAVHRGLTPSTVLVDAHGPRLIDFGVSRAVDGARLTRPGEGVGSPAYLSPEHLSGGAATPPSDLFSLGGALLFAATGADPFGEGEPSDVLYRVLREPPALDGVTDSLRPLVTACLDKLPENRPTAQEVLDHLGGPLPAEPPRAPWLPPRSHAVVTEAERAYRSIAAPQADGTASPDPWAALVPGPRPVPSARTGPRRPRRLALRAASLLGVVALLASAGLYAVALPAWEAAGGAGAARDCSASGQISEDLTPTGPPQVMFPTGVPLELSFSPDGTVLAVSQVDRVTLWDWEGSRPLARIDNEAATVPPTPAAFSPDGCRIAYGTLDGAAVTDLGTGRAWTVGPKRPVRSAAFSPDGSSLAVGVQSDPGARFLHLYDTEDWKLTSALPGSGSLGSIQYSPDGTRVAGGEVDGGVAVWHAGAADIDPLGLVSERSEVGADAFDILPDGSGVLLIRSDRVLLVEPENERVLREFVPDDEDHFLVDVAYSEASGRVFAALLSPDAGSGSTMAWDYSDAASARLGPDLPQLFPLALSPDGSRLAGLRADTGDLAVYDTDLSLLGVIGD